MIQGVQYTLSDRGPKFETDLWASKCQISLLTQGGGVGAQVRSRVFWLRNEDEMDRLGLKWLHPANHFYCQPSCNNNPVGFHESAKKSEDPFKSWGFGLANQNRFANQLNRICAAKYEQNRIVSLYRISNSRNRNSVNPYNPAARAQKDHEHNQKKQTNKQSRKVAVDALQGI